MHTVETDLVTNFNRLFWWLGREDELMDYKPTSGGWSITQVLEHISLTNHFLLRIIQKTTAKAVKRAVKTKQVAVPDDYLLQLHKVDEVGIHKSFIWVRPEHMVPEGQALEITKERLQEQLRICLDCLAQLKNGEGFLVTTSMSVNKLGKIDIYQYLYFLSKHIERHVTQMQLIEKEFELFKEKV